MKLQYANEITDGGHSLNLTFDFEQKAANTIGSESLLAGSFPRLLFLFSLIFV